MLQDSQSLRTASAGLPYRCLAGMAAALPQSRRHEQCGTGVRSCPDSRAGPRPLSHSPSWRVRTAVPVGNTGNSLNRRHAAGIHKKTDTAVPDVTPPRRKPAPGTAAHSAARTAERTSRKACTRPPSGQPCLSAQDGLWQTLFNRAAPEHLPVCGCKAAPASAARPHTKQRPQQPAVEEAGNTRGHGNTDGP